MSTTPEPEEILTFVFINGYQLYLTISEWYAFEDYTGPDALKSSAMDDEGNQYNIYIKPF